MRPTVRAATQADATQITRLLRTAPNTHIHADWHTPGDWLGTPGFVVHLGPAGDERQKFPKTNKFLLPKSGLQACLAVGADPMPAAWVRVAAVANIADPISVLADMFAHVMDHLCRSGVTLLGWLVSGSWPESWLTGLGFTPINQIETYVKSSLTLPPLPSIPGLTYRPAQIEDLETLEQIEAETFDPLWRQSARGLILARSQSICFDVALLDGQVVGYQLSTSSESSAHLVRLAVAPAFQGLGIGSSLLAQAIQEYQKLGLRQVTLNTQVDNFASRRLYSRFEFHPFGQRIPVWAVVPH